MQYTVYISRMLQYYHMATKNSAILCRRLTIKQAVLNSTVLCCRSSVKNVIFLYVSLHSRTIFLNRLAEPGLPEEGLAEPGGEGGKTSPFWLGRVGEGILATLTRRAERGKLEVRTVRWDTPMSSCTPGLREVLRDVGEQEASDPAAAWAASSIWGDILCEAFKGPELDAESGLCFILVSVLTGFFCTPGAIWAFLENKWQRISFMALSKDKRIIFNTVWCKSKTNI